MPELYLRLLDRVLTPVLLVLAIILLMVGHNSPGGGFIAGLVVAAAFQLQILSRGDQAIRRTVGPWLQPIIGIGLLTAVTAAVLGLLEDVFFKGIWWEGHLGPLTLELGTPMLFDVGVFLVVLAVVTSYLLGLSSRYEQPGRPQQATKKGGRR
ncbi:MAG: Na(+)/H(+) antiporter subunit B [Caldilinea sp. CFX5]|nr:Na(+)/H(+) antiporter subunit B [Caldilinea sp. CFX5]